VRQGRESIVVSRQNFEKPPEVTSADILKYTIGQTKIKDHYTTEEGGFRSWEKRLGWPATLRFLGNCESLEPNTKTLSGLSPSRSSERKKRGQ